jgi:hypothetical protein
LKLRIGGLDEAPTKADPEKGEIKKKPAEKGKTEKAVDPEQSVEQRLEETLRQLDALRKSVENLQKSVKKPDSPE